MTDLFAFLFQKRGLPETFASYNVLIKKDKGLSIDVWALSLHIYGEPCLAWLPFCVRRVWNGLVGAFLSWQTILNPFPPARLPATMSGSRFLRFDELDTFESKYFSVSECIIGQQVKASYSR